MRMLVTASANHTLDALLELVCVRVQLTQTQDTASRKHYDAATDWLSREGSSVCQFSPHIFPQGSQRLGTTTKPLCQAEFDLDVVCRFTILTPCHPGTVYRLLWNRLSESEVYRPMMQRMPRCIRLEYSGDFHLDIVPAIPDAAGGGTCLLVPDLDANLALEHPENDRWKPTNPQGYANWFEDRCRHPGVLLKEGARAQVDPLPDQEPIHAKPALKRSVQLIKRWRDVEYKDRASLATPSIILTTLSGHLFRGQPLCTDSVRTILDGMVQLIESGEPICLTNPANKQENICEKWEKIPASYRDFTNAVTAFRDRWYRLLATRGIQEIEEQLSELFEEAPVQWAVKTLAERQVVQPRASRLLGVDTQTGALGAVTAGSSLTVRQNTFFGNR